MTRVARSEVDAVTLLAGNLLSWIPAAAIVVAATRTAEPLTSFPVYFAFGVPFVALATFSVERPLLAKYEAGLTPAGRWLALSVGGLSLSLPGGIIASVIGLFSSDGWGAGAYFLVGALIFGAAGVWCALVGRLCSFLISRSKIAAWLIVGGSAVLVVVAIVFATVNGAIL